MLYRFAELRCPQGHATIGLVYKSLDFPENGETRAHMENLLRESRHKPACQRCGAPKESFVYFVSDLNVDTEEDAQRAMNRILAGVD